MAGLAFIGRLILGLFFLYNGVNHFVHYGAMKGYAAFKHIPLPGFAVILSGLMMLYGGVLLILGTGIDSAVLVLAVALLAFAFGLHNYWAVEDAQARQVDQINFFKNWALVGALLALLQSSPTVWWLH